MRTAYEEDEEELEPLQSQQDRELTLSSTTLLAFFFGLVLVCGLFFGLGYTLGRRSPSSNTPDSVQAAGPGSGSAGALPVSEARPKPSAGAQPVTVTPPSPDPAPEDSQTPDSVTPPTPAPDNKSTAKPIAKDAPTPQPKPVVQLALPSSSQPVAATSPGVMVQIAAVSNPADADVLVKALQKRGYSVTVRHDPSDAFLHVQVGPFATRAEANAMRQKLTSDGYNAILK